MPTISDNEILTVDEVAALFRVSNATVFRWKRQYVLPEGFFKVGRRWLIRREDLNKLMDYKIGQYKPTKWN